MTAKSGLQGRKQRETLFAQGGQIAANATKCVCTSKTAETARDLLLHLDHVQVAFSEVVEAVRKECLHLLEKWRALDSGRSHLCSIRQSLFPVCERPPHVVRVADQDQMRSHHVYSVHAQDKLKRQGEPAYASELDCVRYCLPDE